MSIARGCLIRAAAPGVDDDAVATLMVAYLTWAIERLASEHGVDEPPTHPSLVREGLANYHPPAGRLLLAECDGQSVGVGALRTLRTGVVEVKRMYVAPDWRIDAWDPRSSIGCLIKQGSWVQRPCSWTHVGS